MSAPVALMIGNFDGVHRGHVKLVGAARAAAGARGRVRVLVFEPHPLTVLRPGRAPRRLTTFAERTRRLEEAGADDVVPLAPEPALLAQPPALFVGEVARRYRPSFIVEGPDFRFGRGREGSVETLRALEGDHGYETVVIDPVTAALENQHLVHVSSSVIRWLIEAGRVRDAAALLGRPHELVCPVAEGDRRGRELGVPTANLDAGDALLPADGIYAGRARRDDVAGAAWHPAAISVGSKPTFGASARVCEAYLLDYHGPLDDYGWTIRLEITEWLRDQIRYPDAAALVAQLGRDIARVAAGPSMVTS